jgi:hypothetical protein
MRDAVRLFPLSGPIEGRAPNGSHDHLRPGIGSQYGYTPGGGA